MNQMKLMMLASTLAVSLMAPVASHATGFYLGGNVGYGAQSHDLIEKAESTGVAAIKAGYDFNDYFGVELRYGGVNKQSSEIELKNFASAYAKVQYPISQSFSIYGLVGATATQVPELNLTPVPQSATQTTHSVGSASFGIGTRYAFTENFGMSLELTRIASHAEYKLDSVMLGVDYKF
ncbi:porin family protein [Shewanella waksmanii]|uniref:porin family protein n=1 Tax=Shewanella waksmanii TaxID=213783 RepID=UPI003735A103